ncbi:MmcQ/YjbR family DNA-binding protein [Kineococcus indalonis]|uniref:MmcQ/YjbR family DNA-binding protein n=1 Tax=Kineococcus indalonis TaxID=2696566 RepID=UPI00196B22FF|nr:hypothetical protein [Kineococcus indalonis]
MPVDVDDVRRTALSLPATSERLSWGTPAFFVHDKLIARVHERLATLVVAVADLTEEEELLAADPRVYSTTAHHDAKPYVLVDLRAVEHDELLELLTDAWRGRHERSPPGPRGPADGTAQGAGPRSRRPGDPRALPGRAEGRVRLPQPVPVAGPTPAAPAEPAQPEHQRAPVAPGSGQDVEGRGDDLRPPGRGRRRPPCCSHEQQLRRAPRRPGLRAGSSGDRWTRLLEVRLLRRRSRCRSTDHRCCWRGAAGCGA